MSEHDEREERTEGSEKRRRAIPCVVGVGASAGGLEALRELVSHVPTHDLAFVVVQHLAPDYETMMDQILARHTDMQVELVSDGVEVDAGHVYLIPPGKEMIIANGRLLLTDRDRNETPNLPIDTFFRSLGQLGDRAVAIVLSGTGRDGARGIRAVHEAGGLTLAQTPGTAQFDSMPRAAIDTGCVDLELAPDKMGAALARFVKPRIAEIGGDLQGAGSEQELQRILTTLRRRSGIDFRQYKDSTILRRLQRRMALGRVDDVGDYADTLEQDPAEADALYRDLLVGVTRFFRDPEAWALLARHIDTLVEQHDPTGSDLRAWVAGCATGPEAYTVAMLFADAFRRRKQPPRVKVFATDVHRQLLERASQGVYEDEALEDVPPDLREQWFEQVRPGASVVAPALRELVVFAHHDVTRDPPFTRLDLLTCRNMLIYLRPQTQQRVLTLFHFGLKTSGLLFLGPSESPGNLGDELAPIDTRWKLYRKRRDIRLQGMHRPLELSGSRPTRMVRSEARRDTGARAQERLLARFAPPSVLVNASGDVEHTFVGGGRFLGAADGDFSQRLLGLVEGGLRTAVSAVTHRAWKRGEAARYTDVTHILDGQERTLDVLAEPLAPETGDQSPLVVSFVLHPLDEEDAPALASTEQLAEDRVNALEDQLAVTKENLQATLEEMETSNEELQATNEELIASNEELQSTNEELSSVNEELVTVNAEHQEKISELRTMTADLENLLTSIEVHVLFLDDELRVRRFTPVAARLFRLQKHDVGRRIEDFRHRFRSDTLLGDARKVLETGEPITRDLSEVGLHDRFLVRILPYRLKEEVTGVVFTILDVTMLREVERERERLAAVVAATPDLVATGPVDGSIDSMNPGGLAMLGYASAELPARFEDLLTEESARILEEATPRALERGSWLGDAELVCADGSTIAASLLVLAHRDPHSQEPYLSWVARDMTELYDHARQLEDADRRKDLFLATLSHELRNPLHAIHTAAQLLEQAGPELLDRALPVIRRQSQNLERLLEDLLDVSRITAGQVHLRRERIQLAEVLESAVSSVRTARPEASIEVSVEDGLALDADPTRVEQMVTNLLSNAVKYSPPNSPVKLRARATSDRVQVEVEDEGVGLDADELAHIFEPFVREAGADGAPGLGLGLALVRQLAKLHGGSVKAFSEGRGRGCRFVLTLPQRLKTRRPEPLEQHLDPRVAGELRSILIVDDNEDALEMLSRVLTADGYQVQVANSLAAGREALDRWVPDVALVDIGLPDGSGLDLARAFAEGDGRPALMLALSGYGQPDDLEASRAAGFDDHLVKPVNLDQLRSLLGDVADVAED